jgi:hypothetical protein
MEDVRLTLGTKEQVVLDITDRLKNLTTLNGTNPVYDLRREGDDWKIQNVAVTNTGMRAFCLIDTTGWTVDDVGTYQLYIKFSASPEIPRLGPFEFKVDK